MHYSPFSISTASRVGATFVGVVHHPSPRWEEMSVNAIFSRERPFVVAASARACASVFNAGALVNAEAGKRAIHRSPSDTA